MIGLMRAVLGATEYARHKSLRAALLAMTDEKRHLAWIQQAPKEKFPEAESGAERQL